MKKIVLLLTILITTACTQNRGRNAPTPTEAPDDLIVSLENATFGGSNQINVSQNDLQIDGTLDFGQIYNNTPNMEVSERVLVIKNNSSVDQTLSFSNISSPFSVKINRCPVAPTTLAYGDSCKITIRAFGRKLEDGTIVGSPNQTLSITSSSSPVLNIEFVSTLPITGGGVLPESGDWQVAVYLADDSNAPDGLDQRAIFSTWATDFSNGIIHPLKYQQLVVTNVSQRSVPAGALVPTFSSSNYKLRTNRCLNGLAPGKSCKITFVWSAWRTSPSLESASVSLVKNQAQDTNISVDVFTAISSESSVSSFLSTLDLNTGFYYGCLVNGPGTNNEFLSTAGYTTQAGCEGTHTAFWVNHESNCPGWGDQYSCENNSYVDPQTFNFIPTCLWDISAINSSSNCSDFNNQEMNCQSNMGCMWTTNYSSGSCQGSDPDCPNYTDESSCLASAICSWQYDQGDCSGQYNVSYGACTANRGQSCTNLFGSTANGLYSTYCNNAGTGSGCTETFDSSPSCIPNSTSNSGYDCAQYSDEGSCFGDPSCRWDTVATCTGTWDPGYCHDYYMFNSTATLSRTLPLDHASCSGNFTGTWTQTSIKDSWPRRMTKMATSVVFSAYVNGVEEIFRTDGTPSGTVQFTDFGSLYTNHAIDSLFKINDDKFCFLSVRTSGIPIYNLYCADETNSSSMEVITTLNTGAFANLDYSITYDNSGYAYFAQYDRICKTQGTAATTSCVTNPHFMSQGYPNLTQIVNLTFFNNKLYFGIKDDINSNLFSGQTTGSELFSIHADFSVYAANSNTATFADYFNARLIGGSKTVPLGVYGSSLLVYGNKTSTDRCIWHIESSGATSELLCIPMPNDSNIYPIDYKNSVQVTADGLYFQPESLIGHIYKFDGSSLTNITSSIPHNISARDFISAGIRFISPTKFIFLRNENDTLGIRPYVFDTSDSSVVSLLGSTPSDSGSNISGMSEGFGQSYNLVDNGKLYFNMSVSGSGQVAWVTDGTPAGTMRYSSQVEAIMSPVIFGNKFIYNGQNSSIGRELFIFNF